MPSVDDVLRTIDSAIHPFDSYEGALGRLRRLPRGYALCFAFHYADADILNGGFQQLRSNSTWFLVPTALDAASEVGAERMLQLLKEGIAHVQEQGAPSMESNRNESTTEDWNSTAKRSLEEIESEYIDLAMQRPTVFERLAAKDSALLWGP